MAHATGNAWAEAPHIADIGYSVVKERRGEGLGTLLVKSLIKKIGGNYEIITAGTFSSNKSSKKLLKKFGFRRWGKGTSFMKEKNQRQNV